VKIDKIRMGPACYHVLHVLPPMAAHEMNFFVDEGLVDDQGRPAYEILPGGVAPFNAEKIALAQCMKEKGVTITMDVHPSTVVYLNRRGANLRIIAGWRNYQVSLVMGKAEIKDLADLKGRVVGLKDFKNNRYWALAPWLAEVGLDPERDVRYVRGVSDGPTALREGRVDAAFARLSEAADLEHDGFKTVIDLTKLWPKGRPDRIIVATEELIQQRPEWVSAYVRGMIHSYWFTRIMPDNFRYLHNLERRMRMASYDPDERTIALSVQTPQQAEEMPFPIEGTASGLEEYLQESVDLGEIETADVDQLESSLRLDFAADAYQSLASRPELQGELAHMRAVEARLGY
jgi:hypothetical protein